MATKVNYTTIEEKFGDDLYIQNFWQYLLGYPFIFHVDDDALKYLINKPQLSGCITKWVILLRECTYKIMVQPRKEHANANHLNRLNSKLGKVPIDDSLPNATLFVVDVVIGEYVDIFNYLPLHQFPNGILRKENKKLIQKTSSYTIIGGTLYENWGKMNSSALCFTSEGFNYLRRVPCRCLWWTFF